MGRTCRNCGDLGAPVEPSACAVVAKEPGEVEVFGTKRDLLPDRPPELAGEPRGREGRSARDGPEEHPGGVGIAGVGLPFDEAVAVQAQRDEVPEREGAAVALPLRDEVMALDLVRPNGAGLDDVPVTTPTATTVSAIHAREDTRTGQRSGRSAQGTGFLPPHGLISGPT